MGRHQELIMEYPPQSWVCPGCGKEHNKAHYSVPDQIDYTKKPGEKGRILFNRRTKSDDLSDDTFIDDSKPMRGEALDEAGNPRELYCPHCGWKGEIEILVRVGEIPSLPERFFKEMDREKIPTSWRKLVERFTKFLKGLGKL